MVGIQKWVVALSVPVVVTMVIVRLLTLPWFPAWEYRRAGFPRDPLDLAPAERLALAGATIRFLNTPGRTTILEDLTLPDGTPAYNERELGHMDDVKRVYTGLTVGAAAALAAGMVSLALLRRRARCEVWQALIQGAVLTMLILIALGIWMLVGFNEFFTRFHDIFFAPGTWLFYDTDTLIRLFPLRFWQDAGFLVAGAVLIVALDLLVFAALMRRRCIARAA